MVMKTKKRRDVKKMLKDKDIILKAEDIYKNYGRLEVLKGISFEVKRGETKVVIGPSGTGKSTLLRCINQLTSPDKGRVWLDGVEITDPRVDINKIRSSIGMVFQDFNLFADLTALDNVRIGLTKVKEWRNKKLQSLPCRNFSALAWEIKYLPILLSSLEDSNSESPLLEPW